jgi:dTDP-4-amino-4,6-dideoxygalactose transaminase
MPSYTFVSTANAFVLRGAKIVFADSTDQNPNMDVKQVESLITSKTKAIVVVHYAGIACDMELVMELADRYSLYVVEDAAQAIDSYYKGRPLGSIGHLSAFSFHETKNLQCGEGGMLVVNDEKFYKRAEVIREKGTNRNAFFRGEVDKYGWVDIGSSFLPSEITAAFLFAQLENLRDIQKRRFEIWNRYQTGLHKLEEEQKIGLPFLPDYATNNAHMFYLVCGSLNERNRLISYLRERRFLSVFHYLSLHKSDFYLNKHDGRILKWSDHYSDTLLRLPLFYELQDDDQFDIIESIKQFYKKGMPV